MIRKTKQIKLNIMDGLLVKYGTLDKNSPDVLFIRFKGKIISTIKKNDLSKEIVEFKNEFNKIVKNIMFKYCDIFDCNKYISNIEVSEKGVSYKKGSYIKFDIFILPKEVKELNCYKDIVTKLSTDINEEVITALNKFNLKYV